MVRAKHQRLYTTVKFLTAGCTYVRLGRLRGQHVAFSSTHTIQHRSIARQIAKHADSKIHLVRVGVGTKLGHQAENRIRAEARELLKQGEHSLR